MKKTKKTNKKPFTIWVTKSLNYKTGKEGEIYSIQARVCKGISTGTFVGKEMNQMTVREGIENVLDNVKHNCYVALKRYKRGDKMPRERIKYARRIHNYKGNISDLFEEKESKSLLALVK